MVRLALAAVVLCSALFAAQGGTPSVCAAAGDQGEWRAQPQATASITDSAWKYRDVHATVAATARPATVVATVVADASSARDTRAPSYLLHTPLLI